MVMGLAESENILERITNAKTLSNNRKNLLEQRKNSLKSLENLLTQSEQIMSTLGRKCEQAWHGGALSNFFIFFKIYWIYY